MTMTGERDPRVIMAYLEHARGSIRTYTGNKDLNGLESLVTELAAYRIVKRGADYQTAHSENGVNRSWGSDMMDAPAGFWRSVDKALEGLADTGCGWV